MAEFICYIDDDDKIHIWRCPKRITAVDVMNLISRIDGIRQASVVSSSTIQTKKEARKFLERNIGMYGRDLQSEDIVVGEN